MILISLGWNSNSQEARYIRGRRTIEQQWEKKRTCISIDEDEIEALTGSGFNVVLDLTHQRRPTSRGNHIVWVFVSQTIVTKCHLGELKKSEIRKVSSQLRLGYCLSLNPYNHECTISVQSHLLSGNIVPFAKDEDFAQLAREVGKFLLAPLEKISSFLAGVNESVFTIQIVRLDLFER